MSEEKSKLDSMQEFVSLYCDEKMINSAMESLASSYMNRDQNLDDVPFSSSPRPKLSEVTKAEITLNMLLRYAGDSEFTHEEEEQLFIDIENARRDLCSAKARQKEEILRDKERHFLC